MNLMPPAPPAVIEYPDSDGKPMADNTKQTRWIVVLFTNLCALFAEVADVFVAANLLWYVEEGNPDECAAPDVFVAFSRPPGDRGSYKQWEEGAIAPQVGKNQTAVFELQTPVAMEKELRFAIREGGRTVGSGVVVEIIE